jgi:hypothetical protein
MVQCQFGSRWVAQMEVRTEEGTGNKIGAEVVDKVSQSAKSQKP